MIGYDDWKTTPPEETTNGLWEHYYLIAQDMKIGDVRKDLFEYGVIDTYLAKTDKNILYLWADLMETLNEEGGF